MAKIPEFQAQARIDVPGKPSLPGSPREPAIGAGAAQGAEYAARQLSVFGNAVAGLGSDISAYEERKAAEADDAWLAKARAQTTLDWPTQEAELQAGSAGQPAMGVGGAGVMPATKPKPLVDRTKASLEEYQKGVLAKAPSERAKGAYQQWFAGFGADKQEKAITAELQRQEQQKSADFITALDTHTRLVSTDPAAFDEAWAAVERDLQSASAWADPSKLATLRVKTRADMELARAKTLAINDPLAFQREAMPDPGNAGPESPREASTGWVDNPYYSHLDGLQVAALLKDAQSAVVTQHNAAVAQQKAVYEQRYNDLMTTLLPDGKGGLSDVMEARKTWLTDYGDIKKAIDAIDARDKSGMELAKAQALFTTGHQFNPFENDDKKAVDLVYQSAGGTNALLGADVGAGLSAHGQGVADPQAMAQVRLFAFTEKTGIVPGAAVDEIRRGMISRDKHEMMAAYTLLDGLSRAPETAAATRQAFTEADWKKLEQYQQLAPITTPDELLIEMNPAVDPATAKRRGELGAAGKALLDKEVTAGTDYMPDVLAHFNPSEAFSFTGDPSPSPDGLTVQALRDDYEAAFKRLYSYSGDEVMAKAGALKALDLKWGRTEVGSGTVVMESPPERSFPKIGDSYDWMDQQIEAVAKAGVPDAQEWVPVAMPETEGAKGVRQTPKWAIAARDKDGVWQTITPPEGSEPGWPFNYAAARAQAIQDANATRGSLITAPGGAHQRELYNPLTSLSNFIRNTKNIAPHGGQPPDERMPLPLNPMKSEAPGGGLIPRKPVSAEGDQPPMKYPNPMVRGK